MGKPLYGGLFTTSNGGRLPFVLPAERLEAGAIVEASPHRVAPRCDHFMTCGGCHYQHADYATQLDLKRTILSNLFASAGLTEIPEIETIAGPDYEYRNRIRLRIEPDASGALRAGYSLPNSNEFLPIHMCPIAAPRLWNSAQALLNLASTEPLIKRWLAITSEVELLCTPDESQLQLQFFLRTPEAGKREASSFEGLCQRIQSEIPELTGASALLDPELNRRARRAWSGTTWGTSGLNYPAAGRSYWLPRGAFFQVNRFLVNRLVEIVTANQSGALAWDLYAGVGLFTRALAEHFEQVVAVEGAEVASASLKPGKGIEAVHSSTLDYLNARSLQRERPDLIVLDPPRAGLGPEGAAILARMAVPRVVYVSCDPTTLARDLAILTETYTIEKLHLIDLFPQTFHLETVVHLTKR